MLFFFLPYLNDVLVSLLKHAASVCSLFIVKVWLTDHYFGDKFRFCFAIYMICLYAHICLGISHTVVRRHCAMALLLLRHTSPLHTLYQQILLLPTNHGQPHDLHLQSDIPPCPNCPTQFQDGLLYCNH